jgi:quercetin dioxygenase-like cupin family protein
MTEPKDLPYTIQRRQEVARTDGLKVQILTLAAGEEIPWHSHSIIDDDFFCMEGPMVVRGWCRVRLSKCPWAGPIA